MSENNGRQAAALLDSLATIGVQLWLEDSALRYRAPKGVMTPERLAQLRSQRDCLIEILQAQAEPVTISSDQASVFEPFPLTEVQAAYLTGRASNFPHGGVGCHGYGELGFDDADPARLDAAWRALIARHDMLRAVVSADGTQQVQAEVPDYHIAVRDLRDAAADEFSAAVLAVRDQMDHRVYQPGEWPLFDLRLTRSAKTSVLHFSVDFLIADFVSLQILLSELESEYRDPGLPRADLAITFRDLLLADRQARSAASAERDRAYWREKIADLPAAPELPVAAGPAGGEPRFRRLAGTLAAPVWEQFKRQARQAAVTPTCAVLAAYAEVIRRWSRHSDFTLNVTVLNRPPVHPQVADIVGDFTSVELLAVRPGQPGPFRSRAAEVQATLFEDLDHRLCSGIEVMRELRKQRREGLTLFPYVFTSSIGMRGDQEQEAGGLDRLITGISQTPQVWLDCQVMEGSSGLAFNWDLREGIFPDGGPEVMFGAFTTLLHLLAGDAAAWQSADPVPVPPGQLAARQKPAPPVELGTALLHDQVLAQSSTGAERIAIVAGDRELSYGELAALAASVAAALDERGCDPGGLVAVEMDKGWEQVPAVVGTLLSGRAFVPVDTSQPAARRARILADAGAVAILCQSWLPGDHHDAEMPRIDVDRLAPGQYAARARRAGTDLAYVIYTSGSTGAPKGVMISHHAALNTVLDVSARFGAGGGDRVLALANLGFDLSVYDIFGVLSAGGSLVLPDAQRRGDPAHWASLIDAHKVTLWNSVPAQMEMLLAVLQAGQGPALPSLRLALLSGDWIPLSLPPRAAALLPGLRLISLGGATEAAIWSIFHPIDAVDPLLPSIPYGRPLAGQTVRVLRQDFSDVPDLVAGELWIGGAGLSDGYLGDEVRTAERFVTDPVRGERLYRTGDLGRYLPTGEIEFLGREDSQVKIRGHRVELAEVEAVLGSHPSVGGAAAITVGERPDPIRLAAFVEPAGAGGAAGGLSPAPSADDLRSVATAGAAALRAQVADDQMLAFASELDATALMQMLATLREAGLFAREQDTHSLAEILDRLAVVPRHHRLVRRWLRALAENELVRYDAVSGCYSGAAAADAATVARCWQQIEQAMPDVERRTELIAYFQTTAGSLPELLSGKLDPLTLLFPEGRTEIHEVAYTDMFLSRYLNKLLVTAACHLAGSHHGREPFAVLEVGAGVGGTSVELIPALAAFDVEYLFTDVSEFFLNNARRRFAAHQWVSYGRYDMNRDYRAQGLTANRFDLVVCANVLHYALDVDDTIARLRELLRPGGWILFLEATLDSYQIMTSMEFLFDEASGVFSDVRRLREQTFVERDQWLEVLARAGADTSACLPEQDPITEQMGMHFFAARFKSDRALVTRQDLEQHLTSQLPDHMMPAQLQVVDRLPLTANGKVDRVMLRSWLLAGQDGGSAVAAGGPPSGELELRIAGVWERLLPASPAGRQQTFFELGGDSLLAAQVAAEVRQEVGQDSAVFYDDLLRLLLQNATVASLAAEIEQGGNGQGRNGQAAAATPSQTASPLVSLGDGQGLTVLVHDGTGTLSAGRPVLAALAGHGGLAGIVVAEAASYLSMHPGDVIDQAAAAGAAALTSAGHGALALVGQGLGGVLAAEMARQLTEVGAGVEALVVIGAALTGQAVADEGTAELLFWRELGISREHLCAAAGFDLACADPALLAAALRASPREDRFRELAAAWPELDLEQTYEIFLHTLEACAGHELLPYAGDMTLIRPAAAELWPASPDELAAYWSEVCLGDLRIIDLTADQPDRLAGAALIVAGLLNPAPAGRPGG